MLERSCPQCVLRDPSRIGHTRTMMSLPPDTPSERAVDSEVSIGPPTLLVEYAEYDKAQQAVDKLSDAGFPVAATSIVWNRLRRVEHVTGRKTALTAARAGAMSGAWFGSFIGLLLLFFVETQEETSGIALIVAYLIVGADRRGSLVGDRSHGSAQERVTSPPGT